MLFLQLPLVRQFAWRGHIRHLRLMLEALLALLKRYAEDEYRPAVLDRLHPARIETRAIAHALDIVDDGLTRFATEQEVTVHRMRETVRLDGTHGGNKRLRQHQSAIHALPALLLCSTAIEVLFQRFQIENADQFIECPMTRLCGCLFFGWHSSVRWRHVEESSWLP